MVSEVPEVGWRDGAASLFVSAHASALITLALPRSAALAAGRLASRQTILLNKSALSHSDRLGAARCPRQAPPSLLSVFGSFLLSRPVSPLPPLVHILLFTCLLAFRKRVLISSVTISCQLSLVKCRGWNQDQRCIHSQAQKWD